MAPTLAKAADVAGIPARVICGWIKSRQLEAYVLPGKVRIDEVELPDLLASAAGQS